MAERKVTNRIKVVLAERGKTNRWLAERIAKNETTISRWCSNKAQPSVPVHLRGRVVVGIHRVCNYVYDRHQPVSMYHFRCGKCRNLGLGSFPSQ